MKPASHISWIAPQLLERSWLPEYFAPRYRRVDEAVKSHSGASARLGDIVKIIGLPAPQSVEPTWIVRRRAGAMVIELAANAEDSLERAAQWIALPDECIVLDSMVFGDNTAATFWSSKTISGDAVTPRHNYVLVSRHADEIAWLAEVLSDPLVSAQLSRAVLGSPVPRIALADLLDVRVPRLRVEDERVASHRARRALARLCELARLRSPGENQRGRIGGDAVAGLPILTAATFEQRLEQFERVLLEGLLADSNSGFLAQAARDDQGSDLFVVRRVGDVGGGIRSGSTAAELRPHEDQDSNEIWRQWYWNAEAGTDYEVFNSLAGGLSLPTYLLLRSIAEPRSLPLPASGKLTAPAFAEFRAAIEASRDADSRIDLSDTLESQSETPPTQPNDLARLWERLNPGVPPTPQVVAWLRSVFRPVLAIRVLRESRVAGAYLLFGADQLDSGFSKAMARHAA